MIEDNRKKIESMIAGDVGFLKYFSDQAVWTIAGSKSVSGKQEIRQNLLGPLNNLMESMGSMILTNIVAAGDQVVVEAHAIDQWTKKGEPYNNYYCFIFKFFNGEIQQVTEYCDTALATRVLPELN